MGIVSRSPKKSKLIHEKGGREREREKERERRRKRDSVLLEA